MSPEEREAKLKVEARAYALSGTTNEGKNYKRKLPKPQLRFQQQQQPQQPPPPVQQQQQQYTTVQPQSPFAAVGSSSDAKVIRVSHAQWQQQQLHAAAATALQQQYLQFVNQYQQQQQKQHLQQQHSSTKPGTTIKKKAATKKKTTTIKKKAATKKKTTTIKKKAATKKKTTTIKKKEQSTWKAWLVSADRLKLQQRQREYNREIPDSASSADSNDSTSVSNSSSASTADGNGKNANDSNKENTNDDDTTTGTDMSAVSNSTGEDIRPATTTISRDPAKSTGIIARSTGNEAASSRAVPTGTTDHSTGNTIIDPSRTSIPDTTDMTVATMASSSRTTMMTASSSLTTIMVASSSRTTKSDKPDTRTDTHTSLPGIGIMSDPTGDIVSAIPTTVAHSKSIIASSSSPSTNGTCLVATSSTMKEITSCFFDQAVIVPSSLPNGLESIPETMPQLFDRVGSHKLKMMFPNHPQEVIIKQLAYIWKQLCAEKLSEVFNLEETRYKAHDDLRREEWALQKPNTKYRPDTTDPRMIGFVFNSPTDPAFETPTSQVIQEMNLFQELQLYLEREQYNSALPICSDAESFDKIEVFNWFHYPGHKDSQKCIEKGLLWRSKNGYIGEYCLSYPYSKWAKLANLLGITTDEDNERAVYDNLRNCSAFWDVCPVIGSNKCGGSHHNTTIRDFVTQIFLAFRKKCRNLKHINVFGLAPGKYVREILQPMLQLNGITFSYNNHPQFFMKGGATLVDAENFCKTGLVNLSLALNLNSQNVAHYQARIDSDHDLVTNVIKTITPADLEKRRKLGQALFESKRGIFAEGGSGTTKLFTPEEDELLVMYDRMFSLNKHKWHRIAMYMCSYNNNQCRLRMHSLLQRTTRGHIRNPTSLQKRLQDRTPPVTSYWRAIE